jgi:hypothetical protein
MTNKQKFSKISTVLFRGGLASILFTVVGCCVVTGIYEMFVPATDAGVGMICVIIVCYVVPIGVVAIILGILLRILEILLRMCASRGSSSESTGDENP